MTLSILILKSPWNPLPSSGRQDPALFLLFFLLPPLLSGMGVCVCVCVHVYVCVGVCVCVYVFAGKGRGLAGS